MGERAVPFSIGSGLMPIVDLNAEPSESMRRWFGLSLGCLLVVLGILLAPHGWLRNLVFATAATVTFVYYALPKTKVPIIRGWQYTTFPLAWVIGHLLFGVVFYLILTPIGIILRLSGYDPLQIRSSKNEASQWTDRPADLDSGRNLVKRYFRQF